MLINVASIFAQASDLTAHSHMHGSKAHSPNCFFGSVRILVQINTSRLRLFPVLAPR